MDIRTTRHSDGDNRSPTLEKIKKKRREDRQRTTSSGSPKGSQTEERPVSGVPDPSLVPIEISGNLHKQGRLLKKWKPRFFQVQGNNLYYFMNYAKKECLGLIDLQKCFYVGKSSAASFGFAFELQTWGRTHLLAARDEREAEKWIKVLKKKMVPEARERDKKGSKGEIDAIIPEEFRTRRATMKMPSKPNKRGSVKPSASAHEMTFSGLKSFDEEEEEQEQQIDIGKTLKHPVVTNSQSFPEFKTQQVTRTSVDTGSTQDEKQQTGPYNPTTTVPTHNEPSVVNQETSCASEVVPLDLPPPLTTPPVAIKDSASADLPSPLTTPPVPLRDSSIANVDLPPPPTLVPLHTSPLHTSPRKPLTRPLSVADIELPPPLSFVPMKRANTMSQMELPPLLKLELPPPMNDIPPPMNDIPPPMNDIPPLMKGNFTEVPAPKHQTSLVDIHLPPPIEDYTGNILQSNVTDLQLPPPMVLNDTSKVPVTGETLTGSDLMSCGANDPFILPPLLNDLPPSIAPLPVLHAITEGISSTVPISVLMKQRVPSLSSLNHIPSAIDQLRYILANDNHQLPPNMRQNVVDSSTAFTSSEKTGIEQLRQILVESH